jgi:putative membrane protein
MRSLVDYFLLMLNGVAMGAADVVPGVSGGTIAFISGIYEELLTAISNFNLEAIRILRKNGLKAAWKYIHGDFLFTLFVGIALSIFSLAQLIKYLLEQHPVLIWSFFFGLVLASTWLVGKQISKRNAVIGLLFVLGAITAYWITTIEATANVSSTWFFFVSGMIAICAMILPGISGSFILLLLGSYHAVIEAIHDRDLKLIVIFTLGCGVGLLSFSRVLKWLFAKFKNATLAVLTGFLLGSLNKIWPWKINVGTEPLHIHSDGREEWIQRNVNPLDFPSENQLIWSIGLALLGITLIVLLERFAQTKPITEK